MKAGELIDRMAGATGKTFDVVRRVARIIREEGYLTTGSRGVNAPDMTTLDAAAC